MRVLWSLVICCGLAIVVAAGTPAQAGQQQERRARADQQSVVAIGDIQRLQDEVYDIGADISRLRGRDPQAADQMQGQLDDLRDEVVYLKVKLRKEGSVARTEYWDLRDRIDELRGNVRADLTGDRGTPPERGAPGQYPPRDVPPPAQPPYEQGTSGAQIPPPSQPRANRPNEVPVGTEMDVRLQNPLSSGTAQVEDRFEATTMVDLMNGDRVLIPAGAVVRGVVTSVNKAGHLNRKGSLTLSFDQVTIQGRSYPVHATVDQVLQSEGVRGEVGTIGAGAGVGAIIGGILGGVKGALAGLIIGGGGTVAATTGKDVDLQPGTVLRMRFDSPLTVR